MNRFSVNTNNIISVGYDEVNEILEIEFNLKAIHHYYYVPFNKYISLMTAQNIEEYYFNNILTDYSFEAIQ
jgi:hypothetical protein